VVRDAAVGIVGAILIVGSMGLFIETQLGASSGQDTDIAGDDGSQPQARVNASNWQTSDCTTVGLYWEASTSALEEYTGPHEPKQEGSAGQFWLFAYDCTDSTVDGNSSDGASGAAAFALVEEPDDPHNTTAPDGWVATLEWIVGDDDRTADVLDEQRFNVTSGSASIERTTSPLGSGQIQVAIETTEGTLNADLTVSGESSTETVDRAYVNTLDDPFAVATGPLTQPAQTVGESLVRTSGTTWVERLGLDPSPSSIAYGSGGEWNLSLTTFPADGNETNETSPALTGPDSPVPDPSPPRTHPTSWTARAVPGVGPT
jgi:hypothetical protein